MKSISLIIGLLLYFSASSQPLSKTDSIPFSLTEFNNMSVESVINSTDTVQLMFHLANGGVSISNEAAEQLLSVHWGLTDSVDSWGGMNESQLSENNNLKIGSFEWDSLLLFSCMHSGRNTDGKFGPTLFGNKILEINFDNKIIVLHDQLPNTIDDYEKFTLKNQGDLLFIEGIIAVNQKRIRNHFLLHSGYSSSLLFDDEFAAKHQMSKNLPLLSESELLDSFGNVLKTKKSELQLLQIGSFHFDSIPASFFEGAIGRQKMSVLGMDILKRFNLVLDIKSNMIYLQKNQLFSTPYLEG